MKSDELNKYFKHYLEEDKTHSAIMLTAPWGTGKSYYITTELIPFLESNKLGYALISLYGLKDLSEVSRSLYLELRLNKTIKKAKSKIKCPQNKLSKWFSNHGKEVAHSVVGICKTIIKGVASYFNVDIDFSDKDLQKIFESINLSDKLIILEDLERSGIDIIDILGYVNSLVEQDGVKVLLVANEHEIIKYENKEIKDPDSKDNKTKTISVLTENSKKYLTEKEKTISDTIYYSADIRTSIRNILMSFNNPIFNTLIGDVNILGECNLACEIHDEIMRHNAINSTNLRAVIYACQKTADIFYSVNNKLDIGFAKSTLLSIIAFALRKKQNDNLTWGSEASYSDSLGTPKYPLLDYCYYNISAQYFYPNEFKEQEKKYIEQKKLDEKIQHDNSVLETIYNFFIRPESEVLDAVNHVIELLQNDNAIPPTLFAKLSNYLIAIKHVIGCNNEVDECKRLMLINISKAYDDLTDRMDFYIQFGLEGDALLELKSFQHEMSTTINQKKHDLFHFDYTAEHLKAFCDYINKERNNIISQKIFARKIDNTKLVQLLPYCTAEQIYEISGMYHYVYSFSNINEFFSKDKEAIIDLKDRIYELINNSNTFDAIQKMQLNWFIDTLENIIDKIGE